MMPYSPDVAPKPQNSIIGGATLWVLQGRPKDEYKGVAKFLTYLSSAPVQAKWHQETGYVPVTLAAADITEKAGFYKKFPGRDIAVKELTLNPPTENSKGLRIGNFVQIRDVVDEELEVGVVRQEGRQGRPRRGGEARQRAAAQVRSRQQVGRAAPCARPRCDGATAPLACLAAVAARGGGPIGRTRAS